MRPAVDLILVGGGHAHIQVLKNFAMRPPPGVRVTLVVDTPVAVYSGMVPGFVAGQYRRSELEIDVLPLARLAGARVVMSAAASVDPTARRVHFHDRPPLAYDAVSFDIGSTVAGLETPGVREHALPTRPIASFVEHVDRWLERRTPGGPVAVVGGGAGGVEVAFALRQRLSAAGVAPAVTIIEAGDVLLPGYPGALSDRTQRAAEERGIEVLTGRSVESVAGDHVRFGESRVDADLVVWVAGAAAHPVFVGSGLADEAGFLRIRRTLQSEAFDDVFGVGDCATLVDAPWVPKAGVYAVRQGPVLTENLRRYLAGRTDLESYRPQRDFLTLLNLGDGTAIGAKWGRVFSGPRVLRLKDRIDRKFMARFQALTADEGVAPEFAALAGMRDRMEVLCGGCAAKLGQTELERVIGRLADGDRPPEVELGIAEGDDVAAYAGPDGVRVISSVDQFRPFTDDPYVVGYVGAVNAASDVFAKGIDAAFAQALIALPESGDPSEREEILFQVMSGARAALDAMEITLVGGHTTTSDELLVGFQVEGFATPDVDLLSIDRVVPDRTLVLTKALGTGVLFHADMKGRIRGKWFESALASMRLSNREAAHIARRHGARAATDVTGFGLAGHLASMLRSSDVAGSVRLDALPVLPGVGSLLAAGLRSTFHDENARAARGISFDPGAQDHPAAPLLFDPQTSGGLLFDVESADTKRVLAELHDAGYVAAAAIGSTSLFSDVRLQVTHE
jgi:selenide,water dikinase